MYDIFWINCHPPVRLAILLCPRGGEDLRADLLHYKRSGVETLVSLLEKKSAARLGLSAEASVARDVGMKFLSFPLPDHEIPPKLPPFRAFVGDLALRARSGEPIGIHCLGSIGRSSVVAACTLIHLGWSPRVALTAVEEARGVNVPDTEEQKHWILQYETQP